MEEIKERNGDEREEGREEVRLPERKRFLVDLMLLRLGRWMRLLGQDVANPEMDSDEALLGQAKREKRILITRDKRLFSSCSAAEVEGILICSSRISEQILEMAQRGVALKIDPQRCTLCNTPLRKTEGREGELWICPVCQRLYWRGGHWKNMEETLKALRLRMNERK